MLYIFPADQSQGYWPFGKLTFDGIGDLYGTTEYGGTGKSGTTCDINGCGTVFQLKPPAAPGGAWTETVLHNFGSFDGDGIEPGRGVAFRKGSLYGTTQAGGTSGNGTVFRLFLKNGVWDEQLLYNFTGADGSAPVGMLIFDTAGNLFGTMRDGGITNSTVCLSGCGGIFELSPPAKKKGKRRLTSPEMSVQYRTLALSAIVKRAYVRPSTKPAAGHAVAARGGDGVARPANREPTARLQVAAGVRPLRAKEPERARRSEFDAEDWLTSGEYHCCGACWPVRDGACA